MRVHYLLFFANSAVLGNVFLDQIQNIWERFPAGPNAEGSDIFLPSEAEPDLNIAFTEAGGSGDTSSNLDTTNFAELSS